MGVGWFGLVGRLIVLVVLVGWLEELWVLVGWLEELGVFVELGFVDWLGG